jgi:hypothetical protein
MAGIVGFFHVLGALWKFGDALTPLFEHLPSLLPTAGQAMVTGGNQAINASKTLRQQGGFTVNAEDLVDDLSTAISTARTALNDAITKLTSAADEIDAVSVPTLTPTSISIPNGFGGSVSVITGLGLGTVKPFATMHDNLDDVVTYLEDLSTELGNTYSKLTSLSDSLASAGGNLHTLGTALKDAGQAFQQIPA